MNPNLQPLTEADLNAWVDGQLPPQREAEVEAYLAARPDEAARLATYSQQRSAIKALFDPVLTEAMPERLTAAASPRASTWRWQGGIAASLVLGAALGWAVKPAPETTFAMSAPKGDFIRAAAPVMARNAAIAHATFAPEVQHPVEVPAAQEAHLTAWLSKRLGRELKVPALNAQGYSLVGGRLLPDASGAGPAAQFMYQTRDGQRLTLYVKTQDSSAANDTAFRYSREANIGVFYWIDRGFGYALSGEIAQPQLLAVAETVYKQLNP